MAYTTEYHVTLQRPGYSQSTKSVVIEARNREDVKEIVKNRYRYSGDTRHFL